MSKDTFLAHFCIFSPLWKQKNIECASPSQQEKINKFAMGGKKKLKEKKVYVWVHCNKKIEKRVHGLIAPRKN